MDQELANSHHSDTAEWHHGDVFYDFIRIAIPMLALLLVIFSAIHFFHYTVTRNILNVRQSSHIRIGHEVIRNDVQSATTDLMHLADSRIMQQVLSTGASEAKAHLADEFQSVIKTKKNYDQIRYLDATGMEVVRINYNSGTPLTVPDEKLQNKGKRYYFTDTMKLDEHTIFVSPMDLNIENGRIEHPLKPMLRFGTPVFDSQHRKRGVVLINYLADTLRHNIAHFLANANSMPMLLNAQGYWLMSPDSKDEWGFMFKNQRRFNLRHPEVWGKIVREKSGQVETADGLFTFVTVYPLQRVHTSSSGAADAFSQSTTTVDDKNYFWVLLTHVPKAHLNAHIYDHAKQGALQCALVSLIMLPLVWLFSRERIIRKWARSELHRKEQYLRTITSQLAEGLLVTDNQGQLLTMNKEAERLLGWQSQELIGNNLNKVFSRFPSDISNNSDDCLIARAILDAEPQRKDNARFTTKQNGTIPVSFAVAPFQYRDRVLGAIITFRDITERLQLLAKLEIMATHDPLTGIKNRGEIERLLNLEVDRAKRYQRPLAVMMVDIDHFKKINDTYGHRNGDLVLQNVCKIMEQELRKNDMLGRYGGEEFIVVLPETDLLSATSVAERLREYLSTLTVSADQQTDIRITVSIGIAAYPESAGSAEKMVQTADEMLYKAKESGRNRVMIPKALSLGPTIMQSIT